MMAVAQPWRVWDGSWIASGSLPQTERTIQSPVGLLCPGMRRLKDPGIIPIRGLQRRRDRDVAEQLLCPAQIVAAAQEMGAAEMVGHPPRSADAAPSGALVDVGVEGVVKEVDVADAAPGSGESG